MSKHNVKYVVLGSLLSVGLIGASVGAGFLLGRSQKPAVNNQDLKADLPYLSYRAIAADKNDPIINMTPLRTALRSYVSKQPFEVGVYFEYLPTGSSIGINEQLEVEIASLAKVPATMSLYKQIEAGTVTKSQKVTLKEEFLDKQFGDLWQRGAGSTVTVEELIDYTLKKSDNTAANTLVSLLPEGALNEIFNALDLPKVREGPFPVLSPKSYASVFRTLYLATFNTREHSNEILAKLTQTDFSDRIPAGVPGDVDVSHKIGVFNKLETAQDIYSDCGIVYVPERPYLLCVMTVSENTAITQKAMQDISKIIYGYISQVAVNNR